MNLARFKDLCLDASDRTLMTAFWAPAIQARPADDDGSGPWRLDPTWPGGTQLWINPVPEAPSPVKARVHLDLRMSGAERESLIAAGAEVVRPPTGEDTWWSMTDPEGNEFCAFPTRDGQPDPPDRIYELVVDSRHPVAQARWWASVLGGDVRREVDHSGEVAYLSGVRGFRWQFWVFGEVPEPKTVKNRLHWDVDLTAPGPDDLVAAGAELLRVPDDDISWWILADPEGNEFCAFPPD